MTPEERVDALGKNPCLCDPPVMQSQRACPRCTADAIRAAVAEAEATSKRWFDQLPTVRAEEREACCRAMCEACRTGIALCDGFGSYHSLAHLGGSVRVECHAAAIRARS